MKKILNFKIVDKKLLRLFEKSRILGIIICLFSLLFFYYYMELYISNILTFAILLFQAGFSLIVGAFISCLIIQDFLSN